MKTVIVIDGGPRKNFNTASMLQKFAEGASSVSNDIEVYSQGRWTGTGLTDILRSDNRSDAGIFGTSILPMAFVQRL